jgi:beta-lactamase superfamily II metal-dependent hydrolase
MLLCMLCATTLLAAPPQLDIYFIDVEGGQATLLVSPSGESMLVDAGWPGFEGRDAERIAATAKKAGLTQIDYLVMTHYHTDHVGGVPPLAERIKIVNFVDHGQNTEPSRPGGRDLNAMYYEVREKGNHIIVKPGDRIPIKGLQVDVVSARGEVLSSPLPGAGAANPLCADTPLKAEDNSENARSIGIVVTHGDFRFVDLADITWNIELALACPNNKIGEVDVYLTTHHGLTQSGPAAIVHAMNPRAAVMNNGAKKGGAPGAWQIIHDSPRMKGLWQLHYAVEAGEAANSPDQYIANLVEDGAGHSLKLSANADGSFSILNERNNYSEDYPPAE